MSELKEAFSPLLQRNRCRLEGPAIKFSVWLLLRYSTLVYSYCVLQSAIRQTMVCKICCKCSWAEKKIRMERENALTLWNEDLFCSSARCPFRRQLQTLVHWQCDDATHVCLSSELYRTLRQHNCWLWKMPGTTVRKASVKTFELTTERFCTTPLFSVYTHRQFPLKQEKNNHFLFCFFRLSYT